ncbi:hypothetical protein KFU94_09315 [Chloroflexi bacterium TSY]|nr:hypothetical protein [Chloroflexi bacterium TSY]
MDLLSLLNDCKYGHDIQDNVIRLTALKGATFPDPEADLGEHLFTYSLLPHLDDWRNGTVPVAYALNNPLITHHIQGTPQGTSEAASNSLIQVDSPQVIVETVKQAEDDDGLIVRLYENERTSPTVELSTGFPIAQAYQCNLLEEEEGTVETEGNRVSLKVNPYQIMTVRLKQGAVG